MARMDPAAPAATTRVWQLCSVGMRLMDATPEERLHRGRKANPWPSVYKRLGKDKHVTWERSTGESIPAGISGANQGLACRSVT